MWAQTGKLEPWIIYMLEHVIKSRGGGNSYVFQTRVANKILHMKTAVRNPGGTYKFPSSW